MKCKKCKIELFNCDIVLTENMPIYVKRLGGYMPHIISETYRCPKCFTIKRVMEK